MYIPDLSPTKAKVSVAMITFNHEPYIAQAIEGVLLQRTDFSVELIIGDDCSIDGTRGIVMDYGKRYPERIRLLLPERNLGMMSNFTATIKACSGQYLALCEGDDYWTDPFKLQKQVSFLEAHLDCAICFHRSSQLVQATGELKTRDPALPTGKSFFTIQDVARNHFIPTASIMLRKGLVPELPDWFLTASAGDWPLIMLYAQHGKIGFIDDIMSVHRMHSEGVWAGAAGSQQYEMALSMFETVCANLDSRFERPIKAAISDLFLGMAGASADRGDSTSAKKYLMRSITECPLNLDTRILDKLVLFSRLFAPPVYMAAKRLQTSFRSPFWPPIA